MIDNLNKAPRNQTVKMIILAGMVLLLVMYFPAVINKTKALLAVFYPLLLGAFIAFILNILMAGYERIYFPANRNRFINATRRGMCLILAILTIVLIIYFVLRIVIPQVGHTIALIAAVFRTPIMTRWFGSSNILTKSRVCNRDWRHSTWMDQPFCKKRWHCWAAGPLVRFP